MMTLNIGGKEYRVKFGYNSFCDTDLMDRTSDLIDILKANEADTDKDVYGMGKIKDLFLCVRDLLYVGFKKNNPVATVQDVGDLLDEYHDECAEGHGLIDLFASLTGELMNEGFFGELMSQLTSQEKASKKKK